MMIVSILSMLDDDECHIASCRQIDIGHNPKSMKIILIQISTSMCYLE